MLEAIKNEVFERLAKEWASMSIDARECRIHGYEDLSEQTHFQMLGLHNAIEALGFDVEEFTKYYRNNRSRIREEVIEKKVSRK